MIDRKGWRGAITVYLSIILSSVILLSGILMDVVRIKAAEVQVRRAVNTAASSALAGYHTKLKEDYGLFALNNNDSSKLEEVLKIYLRKGLLIESQGNNGSDTTYDFLKSIVINDEYRNVHFINLFDYKIENVEVVPLYNFTENEIARQQIAEYMKYRAPAQFAENFIEKVNYVGSTADLTDAYKQKTIIEKKLAKIEKYLARLQIEIDKLNKFNESSFDNKQGGHSLVKKYIEYEVQRIVYEAYSSVDIEVSESEEDERKAEKIRQHADKLYENAAERAEDTMEQLEEHVSECLSAAESALEEVNTIKDLTSSLRDEIKAFKMSLQELEKNNKQDKSQITTTFKQDISKWERLIESENSSSILADIERDIEILNNISVNLNELPRVVDAQCESLRSKAEERMQNALKSDADLDISNSSAFDSVVKKIISSNEVREMSRSAEQYEPIKEIMKKTKKGKSKDPRETIADKAEDIKEELSRVSNPPKEIKEPQLLPSFYANGAYPNKVFSQDAKQREAAGNTISDEANDYRVDFDEDSNFSENTFTYITDLASKLQQYASNLRNEIYINEYILATFKDEVEIEDAGTDNKIRDTLFDNDEVEYILAGTANELRNFITVKGEILLIRFGMNTLHVYSDSQKRLKALELATAAAGITGFGIPVVHNLIMCSWGMAESFEDIGVLYQGKRVPFIKTAQTWRTDLIPGGYRLNDNVQNQGSLMDFDYHDYLRLLLLVQNKETKMNRIEDLIQLNMQKGDSDFKLSNYNTYVKVNAQVSIRYWFITKAFVPSKLKTADGRHLINIEAWKGY